MNEEIITTTKWAAVLNHIRANRIEYLMLVAISHLLGLTTKVYGQVEGVCI
jgi:L-serine deaminase